MKNLRIVLLIVFLAKACAATFAQSSIKPINTDVFPPTPNALSLGKFGDVPVGLATGVPSISVPIYSYSDQNGLKLNISIDYHAGGIRVDEISSDVGLGWALNSGGEISRTVRGLPDDTKASGYFYLPSLKDANYHISKYNLAFPPNGGLGASQNGAEDTVQAVYENRLDSQSDIFSFSLNGASGKFVYSYGADGLPYIVPQSKVKIERVLDQNFGNYKTLKGLKVTDAEGMIYYFFEDEDIFADVMGAFTPGGFSYSGSWRLTKIVDPFHRDSIQFTYETASLLYEFGRSELKYNNRLSPFQEDGGRYSLQNNDYSANSKRIKTISLPDGTLIDFSYKSVARKDIQSPGALDQILITNGSRSHGYKFWQSYQNGNSVVPYSPAPTNVSTTLRLFLDSLSHFSGGVYEPAYKFTYSGYLPDRLSSKTDHWGFHNRNANTTESVSEYSYTDELWNIHIDGSNKTPDTVGVKYGSLVKMSYPTQGETEFVYEANRSGDGKLIFLDERTKTASINTTVQYKIFTIDRINIDFPVSFDFSLGVWCQGVSTTTCSFILKVKSLDGTIVHAQQQFSYSELHQVKTSIVNNLPNGDYKLTWELTPSSSCTCNENFSGQIQWKELFYDNSQFAGGMRIKRVIDYDGFNHSNDKIREYEYKKKNGVSSGVVALNPQFIYQYDEKVDHWVYQFINGGEVGSVAQSDLYRYFIRSSSLNYPIGYVNGSPVLYTRVIERQINGVSNNGWLEATFTDFGNNIERIYTCLQVPSTTPGVDGCFPYPTLLNLDYNIAKPICEMYYDAQGNIKMKTEYLYESPKDSTLSKYISFKVGLRGLLTTVAEGRTPSVAKTFSGLTYYPKGGRIQLLEKRTVEFNGNDSLKTIQLYNYDSNYYTLKSTHTTNSKGEDVELRMYYPQDYSVDTSAIALRNRNILSAPIATEEWRNLDTGWNITGGGIMKYQQVGSFILPEKYINLNTATPLPESIVGLFNPSQLNRAPNYFKDEVFYQNFDAKGNLTQFSNNGGSVDAIIWGYNAKYPIAKVQNASQSNIAYTSFENDGNTSWIINSALRDGTKFRTGKFSYALANGTISKSGLLTQEYIISFWATSSNVLVNGTAATAGVSINGWTYYEKIVSGVNSIVISGTAVIDELRLYPAIACMITYTYTPGIGVSSMTDKNNVIVYYDYDAFGRLLYVKDETGGIIKNFTYNYKQ